jgi:hypothetical protein
MLEHKLTQPFAVASRIEISQDHPGGPIKFVVTGTSPTASPACLSSLKTLARRYVVSMQTMEIRLKELGLVCKGLDVKESLD